MRQKLVWVVLAVVIAALIVGCGSSVRSPAQSETQWEHSVIYGIADSPQAYSAPSGWVLTYRDARGVERVESYPAPPLRVAEVEGTLSILSYDGDRLTLDLFRNGNRRTEHFWWTTADTYFGIRGQHD